MVIDIYRGIKECLSVYIATNHAMISIIAQQPYNKGRVNIKSPMLSQYIVLEYIQLDLNCASYNN